MQVSSQARVRAIASRWLPTATLAAVFLFGGAPGAAGLDDDCHRRTARAEHKLHEAIEHHGYYSRQADHWRHELHEARERCWREHKGWWDVDGSRWRRDHDW